MVGSAILLHLLLASVAGAVPANERRSARPSCKKAIVQSTQVTVPTPQATSASSPPASSAQAPASASDPGPGPGPIVVTPFLPPRSSTTNLTPPAGSSSVVPSAISSVVAPAASSVPPAQTSSSGVASPPVTDPGTTSSGYRNVLYFTNW
ncbi:hypothetical protein LX36DRAFT_655792 [Colletotrichum falcatum]|nr:hypothetical protein LX36DRAFT_655792 [Colletotrichum falcatum]